MSNTTKRAAFRMSPLWIFATVIFFILKMAGTIAWSWWWVFAPLWMPVAIVGSLFAAIGLVVCTLAALGVDFD